MKIITTTTEEVPSREYVVDYGRFMPSGWPMLVPVEQYSGPTPQLRHRGAVDRIRVLELKSLGLKNIEVARWIGCDPRTVGRIVNAAQDNSKGAS